MMKVFGLSLLFASVATSAFATPVAAPEIHGSSAVSAVMLLSGGLLVMRTRRTK